MEERLTKVPEIVKLIPEAKRVRLSGYRFAFNKYSTKEVGTGKANIVEEDKRKVWGVIYEFNVEAFKVLDNIEKGYHQKPIVVSTDEDEKYESITYVAKDDVVRSGLKPTSAYLKIILDGARYHHLPPEYISEIEELA